MTEKIQKTFEFKRERELQHWADQFGRNLQRRAGFIWGLIGPLGAGKTTLIRGTVMGLGGNPEGVHSPTFSLVHHYPTQPAVVHMDLYRIAGRKTDNLVQELENIGYREWLDGRSILAIEWFDRLPEKFLEPELLFQLDYPEGAEPEFRRLIISCDSRFEELLPLGNSST